MRAFLRWFRWFVLGTRCRCGGEFDVVDANIGVYSTCRECGTEYYETCY